MCVVTSPCVYPAISKEIQSGGLTTEHHGRSMVGAKPLYSRIDDSESFSIALADKHCASSPVCRGLSVPSCSPERKRLFRQRPYTMPLGYLTNFSHRVSDVLSTTAKGLAQARQSLEKLHANKPAIFISNE